VNIRITTSFLLVFIRCCREYLFRCLVPRLDIQGKCVLFPNRTDSMGVEFQNKIGLVFSMHGWKYLMIRKCRLSGIFRKNTALIFQEGFFRWSDFVNGCRVWRVMVFGSGSNSSDFCKVSLFDKIDLVVKCSLIRLMKKSLLSNSDLASPSCLWLCVCVFRNMRMAQCIAENSETCAVVSDPGYVNEYEICLGFASRKRAVFLVNHGFDLENLFIRRITGLECLEHPLQLSVDDLNLAGASCDINAAIRKVYHCYDSKAWYNYVGTVNSVKRDSLEFRSLLAGLTAGCVDGCVVVYPHIFWDGTFFLGDNCFDGYEMWFDWLCSYMSEDRERVWVVKLHPANLSKGETKEGAQEIKVMEKYGLQNKKNVVVLQYDTEISALELLSIAEVVLTVRGTVALEAALMGKVAVCSGSGRHSLGGLGIEVRAVNELKEVLDNKLYRKYNVDRLLSARIMNCYFDNKSVPICSLMNSDSEVFREFGDFIVCEMSSGHFFKT
jgi:hypothetical protein